jgi:poly(3-hydroxybutyrate) depolymerase
VRVHLPPLGTVGDTGAVALENQVITAGDSNRSYLVAEPPPAAPVSAVIMSLHGTRSTAARQARLSGFGQLARVLLTGMSGGARMSSLFASVHPELVQAR